MRWPDSLRLLDLNRRVWLHLGHAFANFLILGATGSGKTSGPFQYICRALLRAFCGGLFLSVKESAPAAYKHWIQAEGRGRDLVEFGPGFPAAFNFLDYIAQKHTDPSLMVDEVVHVLSETMALIQRGAQERVQAPTEDFFEHWSKMLLRGAIVPLLIVEERINLASLGEMLATFPRFPDEREGFAVRMMDRAEAKLRASGRAGEFRSVFQLFGTNWAQTPPDQREGIRATAQKVVDELCSEPNLSLFGEATTITPDAILDRGALVIVHPAIHSRERVGQVSAAIWKTMVQRAVLARTVGANSASVRPVFIAGDEAHELVTKGDEQYAASSREKRGITVYATQAKTSLLTTLGNGATETLFASLRNRFVCRTDDPATATWLRESTNQKLTDTSGPGWGGHHIIDPATDILRSLRQGGAADGVVEVVVVRGNDVLEGGRRWCVARFRQQIPEKRWEALWQEWTSNDAQIDAR